MAGIIYNMDVIWDELCGKSLIDLGEYAGL
jgi:hypothetical protein